jgi:pyruvate kinase
MPQIVATIGHGSQSEACMRELQKAGATMFRFNAATTSYADIAERARRARNADAECGATALPLLVDLPFPGTKQRLRTFQAGELAVPKGQCFSFVCRPALQCTSEDVLVELEGFEGLMEPGEIVIVGDGELAFRITEAPDNQRRRGQALTKWYLTDGKSIHIARLARRKPPAVPFIAELVDALVDVRPEYLAFSFVDSPEDVREIRALLAQQGCDWGPKIVSKIESAEAVRNLAGIAAESDLLLFARGDMAISEPYEQLGLHQKRLAALARARGVPFIVATQVLETTMARYVPNRSEVLDLTNLILDGAWGVMLAKETSAPDNPIYPVQVARRIAEAVTRSWPLDAPNHD